MTSARGSDSRDLSNIWQFLDTEDSEARSWNQKDERIGQHPTQNFLRPAMYGVKRNSVDSLRSQNGLQMPTFVNIYNDNSPKARKLPRTHIRDPEPGHDFDDVYAMPNKERKIPSSSVKKLPAPVKSNEQKTSVWDVTSSPFSNLNGNSKPSIGDAGSPPAKDDYNMASTVLFKRYEAGSILSTITSGRSPVVYHDSGRKQQGPGEPDEDNVIFAQSRNSSSSKIKLWNKPKGSKGVDRKPCCTKKVLLAVVLAIVLFGAVIAIAVAVSVTQNLVSVTQPKSGNKEQSDFSKPSANVTTLGVVFSADTSHPSTRPSATNTNQSSETDTTWSQKQQTTLENNSTTYGQLSNRTIFSSARTVQFPSLQTTTGTGIPPASRTSSPYFSSTLKITAVESWTATVSSGTTNSPATAADSSARLSSDTSIAADNVTNDVTNTSANGTA